MLEGIEVLNQTEITTKAEWISIAVMICTVLMIIFGITAIIAAALNKDIFTIVMFILTVISAIVILIFIILDIKTNVPTGKYEYQVTINNNVSMTEFHEKYEIVKVEGKIYTIREKE